MAKKLSVAERYMRDVLAGKIITSKFVRLQIERHERDLKEAHKRGLIFDRVAAQHVIDFFPQFLTHESGALDGKPFVLEPFQQAKLWILYGWMWADTGFRRFKFAYNEIGRGNCKSTEASGLCLYEYFAFGEAGPHIYTLATDKETARIVFDTSRLMLDRSPYLREQVTCVADSIFTAGESSKFEPVASGADLLLGLRPHFMVFDELHVSPNGKLWSVFESAMGKRDSPLMYVCTNSGWDRNSVCWKKREYSINVLTGIFEDDTWFAWICGLDEGDDCFDERNWIKANPGLGVMVKLKELREAATRAKNDPAELNNFLRFRMSVWTDGDVEWMPMDLYDKCNGPVDIEALRGRHCIGALDLATTTDSAAFGLVFPPSGKDLKWRLLVQYFLPADAIKQRVKRDRVPYDVWAKQGLFILTPGRVIDYSFIRAHILKQAKIFDLKEICFDLWNSSEIVRELEDDGFDMIKWGQGFRDMAAPTKRFLELVLTEDIAHGAHPVLRWNARNAVAVPDAAGNNKIDKAKSREQVDGLIACIMGVGRAMQVSEQQYTTGGVVYL